MSARNEAIIKLMEKPLGQDDVFQFRCKQCGSCCRDPQKGLGPVVWESVSSAFLSFCEFPHSLPINIFLVDSSQSSVSSTHNK